MSAVVVDTSAWIDFFAGRPAGRLEAALRLGAVMVPPIVVAELLSGVKSRDRAAIIELLTDLEIADCPLPHWIPSPTCARRWLDAASRCRRPTRTLRNAPWTGTHCC